MPRKILKWRGTSCLENHINLLVLPNSSIEQGFGEERKQKYNVGLSGTGRSYIKTRIPILLDLAFIPFL